MSRSSSGSSGYARLWNGWRKERKSGSVRDGKGKEGKEGARKVGEGSEGTRTHHYFPTRSVESNVPQRVSEAHSRKTARNKV
eukprot:3499505-Rhodomonas_salina.2